LREVTVAGLVVMASNECFYLCGVLLIASAVAPWFCKKTSVQEGAVSH